MSYPLEKNSIGAKGTLSSEYISVVDPFSPDFAYQNTDFINIPISSIGRYDQSKLYLCITSPEYRKYVDKALPIFNCVLEGDGGLPLNGANGETCNKIIILNKSISKIRFADGLLTIWSINHAIAKDSRSVCNKYIEKGEAACNSCHREWSDNSEILSEELSGCPLANPEDRCSSNIHEASDPYSDD